MSFKILSYLWLFSLQMQINNLLNFINHTFMENIINSKINFKTYFYLKSRSKCLNYFCTKSTHAVSGNLVYFERNYCPGVSICTFYLLVWSLFRIKVKEIAINQSEVGMVVLMVLQEIHIHWVDPRYKYKNIQTHIYWMIPSKCVYVT